MTARSPELGRAGDAPTPWQAVKEDMAALVREVGMLKLELDRARDKAGRDQKGLLLDLLEVLDAFERVFDNIEPREAQADPQARIWVGNFRGVRKVLEGHLRKHGVARIESPDRTAVPGLHTVVETKENLDLADGTILEELKRGYLWRGEVLRKAEVVTVKN
jgi:molecular chaperone GrpE